MKVIINIKSYYLLHFSLFGVLKKNFVEKKVILRLIIISIDNISLIDFLTT